MVVAVPTGFADRNFGRRAGAWACRRTDSARLGGITVTSHFLESTVCQTAGGREGSADVWGFLCVSVSRAGGRFGARARRGRPRALPRGAGRRARRARQRAGRREVEGPWGCPPRPPDWPHGARARRRASMSWHELRVFARAPRNAHVGPTCGAGGGARRRRGAGAQGRPVGGERRRWARGAPPARDACELGKGRKGCGSYAARLLLGRLLGLLGSLLGLAAGLGLLGLLGLGLLRLLLGLLGGLLRLLLLGLRRALRSARRARAAAAACVRASAARPGVAPNPAPHIKSTCAGVRAPAGRREPPVLARAPARLPRRAAAPRRSRRRRAARRARTRSPRARARARGPGDRIARAFCGALFRLRGNRRRTRSARTSPRARKKRRKARP